MNWCRTTQNFPHKPILSDIICSNSSFSNPSGTRLRCSSLVNKEAPPPQVLLCADPPASDQPHSRFSGPPPQIHQVALPTKSCCLHPAPSVLRDSASTGYRSTSSSAAQMWFGLMPGNLPLVTMLCKVLAHMVSKITTFYTQFWTKMDTWPGVKNIRTSCNNIHIFLK